jgi:metal-responsive CopG/Arc/MetJ family transcriptional regulator
MVNMNTSNEVNKSERLERVGITLPKKTLEELDVRRGDVPRSKFLFRCILEYMSKEKTIGCCGGEMT